MPAPIDPLRHFTETFARQGSPERAEAEKAYLKSPLRFHGVGVPVVRREAAAFFQAHRPKTAAELMALVEPLFESDFHDVRSAGIALLEKGQALLGAGELAELVAAARTFANWAHVDWLAIGVIGAVLERVPRPAPLLRRWAKDESLWVRRTALLAQLPALRRGEGSFALFRELAEPMLDEKEFFIRKAIGWVLREVSKKRADLVAAFVREHLDVLCGVSFREATRHLPERERAQLEALRGGRGGGQRSQRLPR